MALRRNVIANYLSQFYITIVGIVILPLYVKYMGVEAYGLVGFFAMLQAWFNLLDLGLTPTISRETARHRGGGISSQQYLQLYRGLVLIFSCVALVGGGIFFLSSSFVANHWLHIKKLPVAEVVFSLRAMAVCVAMRWISGFYRGVIAGTEDMVWLGYLNSFIATVRFLLILPIMSYFGATPTVFFTFQLIVAVVELSCLVRKSLSILPKSTELGASVGWSLKPVKSFLKFSLTIAFTSSVWVFLTQTDKLVLSGILSLSEYGVFSLAVLVAGGVVILNGPITSAILPRMAMLYAESKYSELMVLYRNSTQFVCVLAGSAVITLIFCAKPLLYAWTGDLHLVSQVEPILVLYAIGNGILIISAFPYLLQYARGDLKYHLRGNIFLLIILIPAIVFCAKHYGGVGAGWVWLLMNILYFVLWIPYVHHKLEPNLHLSWVKNDILTIIIYPILIVAFIAHFNFYSSSRLISFIYVLLVGFLAFFSAMFASTFFREKIKNILQRGGAS